MDADIVKEVEFSRKMRGYDMGEVDAFLEKIEAMLRRRDLENENLQHRLEELDGAREAQSETLAAESRAKTLENAAQKQNHREELQKRLTNAGSAAMDSLKQMSRSIKSLKKK